LRAVQPSREARDVFPTAYRLNTPGALRKYFPTDQYSHHVFHHEAEPAYLGSNSLLWNAGMLIKRATPDAFKNSLMIFLRKRA